jgi:hypothetical protein
MEHKTLEQLKGVAELHPDEPRSHPMSKLARLDRWIALLEREPDRLLNTLHGTEYQAREARDRMRCDNSAISIAYDDPLLRAEGLHGNSYADAKRFFELSHRELHGIVCYCHHGTSISAGSTACYLREIKRLAEPRGGLARVWRFLIRA